MNNVARQPREETTQTRRIPLFALFAANTISFVGDALMLIAIPWFVLQTTSSVTKTGIAAFFETVPSFISAFLGSALVDRLGYKHMSVVSDITSCISVALIPLFYSTIGLAFWQLLVLVLLAGFFQAPGSTARSSLVPDLAPLASMSLERANAASDGMRRVSLFIGAPLAGILIAILGTSNLLWLDAISFAISAALIGLAVPRRSAAHPKEGKGSYLFGAIGHRLPRRLTFALGFMTLSLRFFVFALVPFLPVLLIANIISGLGAGPLNPIMSTVEQEVVPPEMRARVFGTTTAGAYIGMPLGALLCGYLVQWAGILPSLFVLGVCYLLTTTSLLVNSALKEMARRPEEATR